MKILLKILLIGTSTTIVRIICQLLIPTGEQNILPPSLFVVNGTMPLAFAIYGIIAYSIIAMLFQLIKHNVYGKKITQGIKFSLAYCAIWVIYLLEPLPHVAFLDKFTYPIADSIALIVMGILCGLLFGKDNLNEQKEVTHANSVISVLMITFCFFIGRILQYTIFDIYASFETNKVETIIWCFGAGLVAAIVSLWFSKFILNRSRFLRAVIVGLVLFGINLFFFNFFMPLVFDADIPDLVLRTAIDVVAVTVGCFSLPNIKIEKH